MNESQNIEFKEKWKDEYLKWICGFANSNGGSIYIGKNDEGKVVGLENSKKLLEDIPNKTRDTLGIIVDVYLFETSNGDYIEIKIEKQPFPVNYKGQYHYRSGSTKQELKGVALDNFLLQKRGKKWDGVPVSNISISDLDIDTFKLFKKLASENNRIEDSVLTDTNKNLIENLQLQENQYLKRAGILLFHPNPDNFITGAYIKIGYFRTDDDLIYQDEVHGNIFNQIEKTIELLFSKYLKSLISYEGIHRKEKFEFPKEAIREALLNAIAHKDYASGIPIQISVYDEKLMIWNEGHLPQNWTIENLKKKHPSKPYNPDIANTLFRAGYIESWGRGTLKIIKKVKEYNLPEPEFNYEGADFWVIFRKDIYNQEYLSQLDLNDRQVKALLHWKNSKEITNSAYCEKFDISDRTALRDLNDLVDKKLLVKIGEKKKSKYIFNL